MPAWEMKVGAVLSAPRLGFTDHFDCVIEAVAGLDIPFQYVAGGFWGQCLETGMEDQIARGVDVIVTMDYDTIFQRQHVFAVLDAVADGCDCAVPLMIKRYDGNVLPMESDPSEDHFLIGHFGLTAFRVDALKRLPKPWFISEPDQNGSWRPGRVDEDVRFWREWRRVGNSMAVLRNVAVGHLTSLVVWPGGVVQQMQNFRDRGPPPQWAWRPKPSTDGGIDFTPEPAQVEGAVAAE